MKRVSIPFIAGQWSLPREAGSGSPRGGRFQSPSLRGSGRFDKIGTDVPPQIIGFNPLHCGAVVASASVQTSGVLNIEVSIPFIAGQWSLLVFAIISLPGEDMFQSPSLRGSGRFRPKMYKYLYKLSKFQSPSLRGSGRF